MWTGPRSSRRSSELDCVVVTLHDHPWCVTSVLVAELVLSVSVPCIPLDAEPLLCSSDADWRKPKHAGNRCGGSGAASYRLQITSLCPGNLAVVRCRPNASWLQLLSWGWNARGTLGHGHRCVRCGCKQNGLFVFRWLIILTKLK